MIIASVIGGVLVAVLWFVLGAKIGSDVASAASGPAIVAAGGAAAAGSHSSNYAAWFASTCDSGAASRLKIGAAVNADFSGGVLPTGAVLAGDSFLDANFGVTVDGEDDYIALGPTSAETFGASGSFTVSFMFTKFR